MGCKSSLDIHLKSCQMSTPISQGRPCITGFNVEPELPIQRNLSEPVTKVGDTLFKVHVLGNTEKRPLPSFSLRAGRMLMLKAVPVTGPGANGLFLPKPVRHPPDFKRLWPFQDGPKPLNDRNFRRFGSPPWARRPPCLAKKMDPAPGPQVMA